MKTFSMADTHPATLRARRTSPPDLHWFYVLALGVCTCGFFVWFWEMYLSIWAKRLNRRTKASAWYAGAMAVLLTEFFLSSMLPVLGLNSLPEFESLWGVSLLLAGFLILCGRRELCRGLQDYLTNIDRRGVVLNKPLSFLLGSIYFQYKLGKL
jgi:hypothetical protein